MAASTKAKRSAAAKKAARTRKKNKTKRSAAAKTAARTRRRKKKKVRNSSYTPVEVHQVIHILVIWFHGFLQNGFKTSLKQKCIFS